MTETSGEQEMHELEKLGVFYLGREYDGDSGQTTDNPVLYDSRDLTTHAVCVGMTGSGKTGLCISLLEEAAMDGIPAIAIDPKGDLSNLMLTFPGLSAEEFLPWIDPQEAARKNLSPEEFAAITADTWREGLARWGQDGGRIGELRERADFRLFTPGGSAGIPLSVLHSLDAPPPGISDEPEALGERIETTVSGFLTLAGERSIEIHGRDHVLLSGILNTYWGEGRNLSLEELVRAVQAPPMARIGVLDTESFFPSGERMKLAMKLNSLLASPSFAPWTRGEPLNISNLLHTPGGKPRISILSISHLSQEQRMFFVSLLLNEVVSWVRTMAGTGSLRAILYMDEIFGFFPPGAEPPSKKPMLTLLKQARAHGLGVVLATQNPVDLDYRGLSNTGTWFVGRLQTERDKNRLMDGLEGASSSSMNRSAMDRLISRLDRRVFLMHSVHREAPMLFRTRWAMSYLRGPLTGADIRRLGQETNRETPAEKAPPPPPASSGMPLTPPDMEVFHGVPDPPAGPGRRVLYRPCLFASARLHFVSARDRMDIWEDRTLTLPLTGEHGDDWEGAQCYRDGSLDMVTDPVSEGDYEELPPRAITPSALRHFTRRAATWLYQEQTVSLWSCDNPKASSEPGEERGDFAARLLLIHRENLDSQVDRLRQTYERRFQTTRDRVRRAEQRLERDRGRHSQQRSQTAVSIGATLMGAFLGRGVSSSVGRAATAARGVTRSSRSRQDIALAENELKVQKQRLEELEREFGEKLDEMDSPLRAEDLVISERLIRPRKTDIHIARTGILWMPR